MADPDPDLQAALDALTDDGPFDWDAAAAAAGDAPTRATLAKLRLLAAVAHACREDVGNDVPRRLPTPPFTWGTLEVVGWLGRGASGDVFRAHDPRLDRLVALKLLPLGTAARHTTAAGIVHEARMLARAHHPHVVSVHGAEEADGYVGIWMELVDGPTLERVVQEDGTLPVTDVLAIGRDLCDALAAVHEAGLVHGDVKAQNIVRTPTGRVVLMDFGAGRDMQYGAAGPLTGTPLYMAPEVLGGAPVSVRSDVYALGVLMHHLLTGSYPSQAHSLEELTRARGARRSVEHGTGMPAGLARVLDRALAVDPSLRFPDTGAMAAALTALIPLSRATSRIGVWTSAAVLAAGVVATIGWLALERRAPQQTGLAAAEPTLRRIALPAVMLMGRPAPDGEWIAVSDLQGNVAKLSVDDGGVQPLTNDASLTDGRFAEFSSVSPDGHSVAYGWAVAAASYELRIVGLDGTPPRTVYRATDVNTAVPLDWWPDGQSLLVALQHTNGATTVARLFHRQQRLVRLATVPGMLPEHASLSPDGEWVAYDAPEQGSAGHRDIHVVRADGTTGTVLVAHAANDFAPIWSGDGRRLLFLSDRSGALDLWSTEVSGATPHGLPVVLMRDMGRMRVLGLTTAGTLLHQRLTGAVDVYITDITTPSPVAVAETFFGMNLSARWSPDGSAIAYASRRGVRGPQGGTTVLVVRDLLRGTSREWSPPLRSFLVSDWAADGRRLLLYGFDETAQLGLHEYDIAESRSRPALPGTPDASQAQFTRAGGLLYVNGARRAVVTRDARSGQESVLLDFRTAKIEGIVGGAQARGVSLSPDERLLAYSGSLLQEGRRMFVLRVLDREAGVTRELARTITPEVLLFHDWTADGRHLIVTRRIAQPSQPPALWRVRVDDGMSEPLGLSVRGVREVSAAPTGNRLAFTSGIATSDVWALEHVVPR